MTKRSNVRNSPPLASLKPVDIALIQEYIRVCYKKEPGKYRVDEMETVHQQRRGTILCNETIHGGVLLIHGIR